MELNKTDREILHELDYNCRSSLSAIGKKLHLNKSAIAKRIQKLEREKFILGYYTLIDSSKLGYISMRIYMKFQKISSKIEEDLTNYLKSESRIWWLGKIQGMWDMGIVMWVKDVHEFRNFWLSILVKYRKYIGNYIISAYSQLRNYHHEYLVSKAVKPNRQYEVIGEASPINIDKKDKEILSVISTNARMPTVEIAEKAGLTASIVKYRIKQLLKKDVIKNFRVIINTPLLDYSLYKVDFILDDTSKVDELKKFIETFPSLYYIDETVGGGDLEVNFQLKNTQELEELLNKIKNAFGNVIREYNYYVYTKFLKYTYFPEE